MFSSATRFLDRSLPTTAPGGVDEDPEDFADRPFLGDGFRQRQLRLDAVAVAAPVLLFDHVPRLDEVTDDAVGAALGDAEGRGQVSQPEAGVSANADEH